jgi:hypothetical protein
VQGIKAHLARRGLSVDVIYVNNSVIANAVAAAKKADLAIVFAGVESSEGYDRVNLSLWQNNARSPLPRSDPLLPLPLVSLTLSPNMSSAAE